MLASTNMASRSAAAPTNGSRYLIGLCQGERYPCHGSCSLLGAVSYLAVCRSATSRYEG
jgi:hypothetical protein